MRVSPFGYLRIDAYVPLPVAFRSLSRPSSAPDAKAFPLRSFQLDLDCITVFSQLFLELCRHFFKSSLFEIVVLPFSGSNFPQLLSKFVGSSPTPLCCLAFLSHSFCIVQFSRCKVPVSLETRYYLMAFAPQDNICPQVCFSGGP